MNRIEKYPNAVVVKTHNKKVSVCESKDDKDSIHFEFMSVSNNLEPRAAHLVLRDRVVVTAISLSKVGAISLHAALSEYLKIKGIGYTTDSNV